MFPEDTMDDKQVNVLADSQGSVSDGSHEAHGADWTEEEERKLVRR